mmetsp:Transcript_7630/g.15034  ORF Transcript_7630/g.15034 Transcript_7630/m.15034 type:complete len:308 (+) Transcript_7630:174-1097(+)
MIASANFDASSRVKAHINIDSLVGQPPDADPVHSRLGNLPDRLERDPPRRLKLDAAPSIVTHLDRFAKLVGSHIVKQHVVNAPLGKRQKRPKLLQVVYLHLKKLDLPACLAQLRRPAHRCPHPLRHLGRGEVRYVVVLYQHRVVQTQSVAVPPPAAHRVLFKHAQTRRCLASVEKLGFATLPRLSQNRLPEGAGAGCDAAEPPDRVEDRSLQCEHLVGGAREGDEGVSLFDVITVFCLEFTHDVRRQDLHSLRHDGQAAHDQLGPRPQQRLALLRRLKRHLTGQVPRTPPNTKVLITRKLQQTRHQP